MGVGGGNGEDLDSSELAGLTVFCDAHTAAGPPADALADDPLTDVDWVLWEVECAETSGGLLLLPAGAQVGCIRDGGYLGWCVDGGGGGGCHIECRVDDSVNIDCHDYHSRRTRSRSH